MSLKQNLLCMVDLDSTPEALDIIKEIANVDYVPSSYKMLHKNIGNYDAYWGHVDVKVDSDVLSRAERLKVIATASTGTDHIDKETASSQGIKILSITTDYELLEKFTATAELAWALLIMCTRNIRQATREVFENQWRGEHLRGRQLSNMTLGVLGVGRLGKMTARYGKVFCKHVIGCDLKPIEIEGVESVDFDVLLAQSDAISIHVHMTPENYHLFNATTFAKMKKGAILINTSRGDVIDEAALIETLESERLSAFGADVLHNEWRENIGDHPLINYARIHENVIITPHIGGCTFFSLTEARIFMAKKLARYLRDLK